MKTNGSILYTDGACSGNPGPGGWGAVLFNFDTKLIYELGSFAADTTNNRMEMTAIIEGVKLASSQKISTLLVLTDSTYVIRGYTQWRHGWKKRGWKTAEGQPVSNQDLWQQLEVVGSQLKLEWKYVRGHQGTPGNERVDEIAVAFSKRDSLHLDFGLSPKNYHFDIMDLPEGEPLPEMKSHKTETRHSFYVSLVNGTLTRHTDWGSCERAVKGQSKAQFKKVSSENEFQETLKKWGYSDGN
jgi:ribonuclease HI